MHQGTAITQAEWRTLQLIAGMAGRATWYQVARLLSPQEFPGQGINSVHLLQRLEQAGLITESAGQGGPSRRYEATTAGAQRLIAAGRAGAGLADGAGQT